MKKLVLVIMVLVFTLYSEDNIIIVDGEKDSAVTEVLIKGNGEECKVSMDSAGRIVKTSCLQLTNSKKVKILCTAKKKICKTELELQKKLQKSKSDIDTEYGNYLQRYDNGNLYPFTVEYPVKLLPERWLDAEGKGAWFVDKEEGEVMVKVFGKDTGAKNIQEAYRNTIKFLEGDSDNEITFKVQKGNWFVFSGYNHEKTNIFYFKYYFLKGNQKYKKNRILGFDINYPTKKKRKYVKLVNIINKSFKITPQENEYKINNLQEVLITGNGEQCKVYMDSLGVIVNTTCSQQTNSKKIKILCTKNKKMCKTISEVRNVLDSTVSLRTDASSLKDLKSMLKSRTDMYSASFDCTKASTQTEHDICQSDRVSALDLKLGNIYLKIKNDMPNESFQNLIQIQREWVKERDRKCSTKSDFTQREQCLIKTYNDRISAFNMISVMDSQIDYRSILFSEVYENGTSEERFKLSAYLYFQEKNIKKASKLLRKIIADNQEDTLNAFTALNDIHKDYVKKFPQVSKKLLEENHDSVGVSLIDLNTTHDEVLNVLIQESYLLDPSAQIMLSIKYKYPVEGQPIYDKRILSFYEECAGEGVPRCEVYLGNIYMNGWGVKKNVDKGIKLLKKSELGDAYLSLAEYYYIQKDIENCKKYSEKASELGETKGMHNLGILAQEENKYEDAIKYFEAALKIDDKYYPSMMELSKLYIEGLGTEKKYKKAIDMLQVIIDGSNEPEIQQDAISIQGFAEYRQGLKYLNEKAFRNESKAFTLIEKSAKKNNVNAQYSLARMYFNGRGVEKDEKQVIKWYEKAAEQGHPEAQLLLSFRYLDGRGVKKDHAKGLYWVKKSAENEQKEGQYLYGMLLLDENKDEAMGWLEKAAKQGHAIAKEKLHDLKISNTVMVGTANHVTNYKKSCLEGNAVACNDLGLLYRKGEGVKQDYSKAKKYYGKACDLDDGLGCSRLASLHFWDKGAHGYHFTTEKYYKKACDLNYAKACSSLGLIYASTMVGKRDYNKAKKYYKKACDLNEDSGCYQLGFLYKRNVRVEQDYLEAKKYFNKACDLKLHQGCYQHGKLMENSWYFWKLNSYVPKWLKF